MSVKDEHFDPEIKIKIEINDDEDCTEMQDKKTEAIKNDVTE